MTDAKVLETWLRKWLADKHDCGTRIAMRTRDTSCLACQIYTHLNNKSWEPEWALTEREVDRLDEQVDA